MLSCKIGKLGTVLHKDLNNSIRFDLEILFKRKDVSFVDIIPDEIMQIINNNNGMIPGKEYKFENLEMPSIRLILKNALDTEAKPIFDHYVTPDRKARLKVVEVSEIRKLFLIIRIEKQLEELDIKMPYEFHFAAGQLIQCDMINAESEQAEIGEGIE